MKKPAGMPAGFAMRFVERLYFQFSSRLVK